MKRADIALLVAMLSAAFTAGGLVWQLVLYRLSGHRLLVRLVPAVVDSMGTIVRGPEEGFKPGAPTEITSSLDAWTVDLAEVQVTNVGRMAVSVSEVSLDVRSPFQWSRKRHTIRGVPLALHGASTDDTARIEPGESIHVLFDIWSLIGGLRRRGRKAVVVRGSARAAGRRPRRSRWRKRWTLDAKKGAFLTDDHPTPAERAFQALWRSLARDPEALVQAPVAWMIVEPNLDAGTSIEDLAAKLEPILAPGHYAAARAVLRAFLDTPD